MQGLQGARIKVQNEAVDTETAVQTTDSAGEALFSGLPACRYKYRITAADHIEQIGRLWVKPAVTVNEEVFLDYNLVSVEWEVNETTIEDRYEITLNTTFETDVPAAVVVVSPASVTLPKMQAGDVLNGEFTLTNHGLIRADNIVVNLPPNDQHFKYEILGGVPDSMQAKERITIPYRITCLSPLEPEEEGTGGGCRSYQAPATISYGSTCANEQYVKGTCRTYFTRVYDCTASTGSAPVIGSAGGTVSVGGGSGGGGGSISKPAPKPKTITGVECFPEPSLKERFLGWWNSTKETRQNWKQKVGCDVNTVTRQFTDDDIDLSVKVPGGIIQIQRRYYAGSWNWEHLRNKLTFSYDSLGSNIASINKGGVEYEATGSDGNVYVSESFRITRQQGGYRWQDKFGSWQEYDDSGRLVQYGSRSGVIGKLLYESGEDSRLVGIADRNGHQVIWYEYGGSGQISAIQNTADRQVGYTYTDGRLTKITDVLENETSYEYDGQGRITTKVDAGGRPTIVVYIRDRLRPT